MFHFVSVSVIIVHFFLKNVSGEVEQYVCRVVREMEIKSRQITHPVVTSVYIGGGTIVACFKPVCHDF
jgi:coproporphyrinogen III oxidase-like Fe-S oxidoreductase